MQEIRMFFKDETMDIKDIGVLTQKFGEKRPVIIVIGDAPDNFGIARILARHKIPELNTLIIADTTPGRHSVDDVLKAQMKESLPIRPNIEFDVIPRLYDVQETFREPKPHQIKYHEFKHTKPRRK